MCNYLYLILFFNLKMLTINYLYKIINTYYFVEVCSSFACIFNIIYIIGHYLFRKLSSRQHNHFIRF